MKRCRECGCTDARGCLRGCFWVFDDLCSQCVLSALSDKPAVLERSGQELLLEQLSQISEELIERLDDEDGQTPARMRGPRMDYAGHELPRLWQPGDPI